LLHNTLQKLYKYIFTIIFVMFLKLKTKNSTFKIVLLNDDIIYLVNNLTNIKCHVCNKKYKLQHDFYKKQSKFYYCSKNCYCFI
jgi:hypothetical protein